MRVRGLVGLLAFALAAWACHERETKPKTVVVRNPDYLVVRPIRREADAEHSLLVDLP